MQDARRPGRAVVALTVAAALLAVVAVIVWNAPANWLALQIAERTHGVVLLADARGTIWSGSAVMALGAPSAADARDSAAGATPAPEAGASATRFALPGRIIWTLSIDRSLAPVLHLTHDGMLLPQPVSARLHGAGVTLDAGAAVFPASMLRLAGVPLNTLLPDGRCELRWNGLLIGGPGPPVGDGTVRIGGLSLAISPVRPLGDYRVDWSSGAAGLTWQLATERGPLDLRGAGSVAGRRTTARVVARVAREAPAAVTAQLNPLLDLLGRRSGSDEAIIAAGGPS